MTRCERCDKVKASDAEWERPHDERACDERCWCRRLCWDACSAEVAHDWRAEALRLRAEVEAMRRIAEAIVDSDPGDTLGSVTVSEGGITRVWLQDAARSAIRALTPEPTR